MNDETEPETTSSPPSEEAHEEAHDDMVAEPGDEPGNEPGPVLGRRVVQEVSHHQRVGDGTWPHQHPGTREEAWTALSEAAGYCQTRCPIVDRCAGEMCAIYRGEQAARAILIPDRPEATVGVVQRENIV